MNEVNRRRNPQMMSLYGTERRHFSNILNNSHMRYVPKTRMKFDYQGGDGPMCLIFDAGDSRKYTSAKHTWKVTMLGAMPAAYYA